MSEIYRSCDRKLNAWGMEHKKYLKLAAQLLVFLSPVLFASKSLDNDVWFLLNSGRYISENGFTRVEPFSIYKDLKFSFQQWLTDILFYRIYMQWGRTGLLILVMILASMMLVMFYRLCLLVSGHNTGQSLLATLLLSVTASPFMITRPHILSAFFLTCILLIMECYVKTGNKKLLWLLLLCSVLEINFHASTWWIQFLFMLPYLVETDLHKEYLEIDVYDKKPVWLTVAGMLICGSLNPYSITNMLYLFRSIGSSYTARIGEMKPTTYDSIGMMVIVGVSVVIFLHFVKHTDKIKLRYALLYAGTMLMALVNIRSWILFFIVAFMSCAYVFRKADITCFSIQYWLLYLELVVGACLIAGHVSPNQDQIKLEEQNGEIALWLTEHTDPSKDILYTEYDTGGFYEYKGFRCSLDARMEVFRKSMNGQGNYFDEWVEADSGYIYYKDYLDKYHFNYLVLEKGRSIYTNVAHDPDYECLYDTEEYALYGRKNEDEQ